MFRFKKLKKLKIGHIQRNPHTKDTLQLMECTIYCINMLKQKNHIFILSGVEKASDKFRHSPVTTVLLDGLCAGIRLMTDRTPGQKYQARFH